MYRGVVNVPVSAYTIFGRLCMEPDQVLQCVFIHSSLEDHSGICMATLHQLTAYCYLSMHIAVPSDLLAPVLQPQQYS